MGGASSGLSAGLGIGGGIMGSYYGNKAASAERAAANSAIGRFEAGKQEALGFQQPYAEFGRQSLSPLSQLLYGKNYDPSTGTFSDVSEPERFSSFFQSPGYQFRFTEGLRALQNSQAARGNLLSGGGMKEITQFGQGLASDEYGNYLNSLFQAAGIGQTTASNQSNIATGAATSIGNMAYSGGMANANKYANISNLGYQTMGMGLQGMMQSAQQQDKYAASAASMFAGGV